MIIITLIAIPWSWLSFTHSSIKRLHSSVYSLPAFPEGSINKFLFRFIFPSCVEETTCCRSIMERFPKIFISVDGCTVNYYIVCVFTSSAFFWCWIKPLEVLKCFLHVAHRVVSCLVKSLLFYSSPFFGCWFAECSLFRWSIVPWYFVHYLFVGTKGAVLFLIFTNEFVFIVLCLSFSFRYLVDLKLVQSLTNETIWA